MQECENLDTYTNAINQLGWTLVSSSCRKAAIAFRGRACHNIVRSFHSIFTPSNRCATPPKSSSRLSLLSIRGDAGRDGDYDEDA